MKFWNALGATLAVIALSLAAAAQTPTPPATCTTAPTSVTAFNIERVVPLTSVLTTLTPTAPANVLAGLAGGALEIHEQLIYNPQLGTVTSTIFLVAAGSPVPTPQSGITNIVQTAQIQLREILTSCSPTPSILFVGTVTNSSSPAGSVYGVSFNGAPAAVSVGYTTDTPAKINNVAVVVAGSVIVYSSGATGTLTVPAIPAGPGGGGGGTGPTIVVKFSNGAVALPNSTIQAPLSPFLLDASSSTCSGALTYSWSASSGSPVAFVGTDVPGKILVQFPGSGGYTINLKVTDASGASATFSITLLYTGRPQ
jgi:hypothetical protein